MILEDRVFARTIDGRHFKLDSLSIDDVVAAMPGGAWLLTSNGSYLSSRHIVSLEIETVPAAIGS